MNLIVMTFGPTALQAGDSLLTIGEALQLAQQAGYTVIAVIDALPGVKELLWQSVELGNYQRVHNKLHSIYSTMARKLIREESDRALLLQDIADILGSYQWLGRSIINRNPTPAEAATMIAIGERLSARLLAAHLQNRGAQASALNGHELLATDDNYLSATPDLESSRQHCNSQIPPLVDSGYIVIVGSSGGSAGDNRPTRLTSEGLYLTASLLAAIHRASGLWLMQPHDGILTADPDYVADAQTIPVLPITSLTDMADYGCDMPSGNALETAIEARIPIFVRSAAQLIHPGTFIQPRIDHKPDSIGPIVVQRNVMMLHASGIEAHKGLATLHNHRIPAVMGADGEIFFIEQDHFNSAYLTLSQAFPDDRLQPKHNLHNLVTVLGIDASDRDYFSNYLQTGLRNASIPSPEIIRTVGRSGNPHLSVLVPSESIEAAVNEIHKLLPGQIK